LLGVQHASQHSRNQKISTLLNLNADSDSRVNFLDLPHVAP
jgi:hypothetical protein